MPAHILSISDILRDEYEDYCPNMAYKNAPEAPEAFEGSEENLTDSDRYRCISKDNCEAQAANKGCRASDSVNRDR
ncbi:hypothetical protein IscW_ISCW015841 [Ixodes scapularis]|uniref:Uncharacterized protein n=1 Tax=Ixodes scapularis TaxID=6945 RepID=B7P1H5_IXOSC|nr:hypothetical protein IscW_ISCW015841 [Ixodes scapularis]|eukprot:XP_002433383.1 hypothetical protein IscW_ISCW015841 [Ixodes scapularis]